MQNEPIEIDGRISYLPATDEPLSAEIVMIRGDGALWLYDVGADPARVSGILDDPKPKRIVLSHFHPDHTANLPLFGDAEVYAGANTLRYTGRGIAVSGDLYFTDGIALRLFPIPSSHAKGSVGLEVGDFAFLGDATYATKKDGRVVYNAGLLLDMIRVLEKLDAVTFFLGHNVDRPKKKEEVLSELREILGMRRGQDPYIPV